MVIQYSTEWVYHNLVAQNINIGHLFPTPFLWLFPQISSRYEITKLECIFRLLKYIAKLPKIYQFTVLSLVQEVPAYLSLTSSEYQTFLSIKLFNDISLAVQNFSYYFALNSVYIKENNPLTFLQQILLSFLICF